MNPTSGTLYLNCPFATFINSRNITLHVIGYNGKRDLLKSFIKISYFLTKIRPIIVHTHLFDASLIGLLSAFLLRIKHRIHTRHHSTYHHASFPHAVKFDKLINRFSTRIIAISKVVQDVVVLQENTRPTKVTIVYHGNNADKIHFESEKTNLLKTKYSLSNNYPVIGVIARYIEWKGIQYIIPAFNQLLSDYPNAKLVLAGTGGPYERIISELISKLPKKNFIEINFESDIWNLYKTFNLLVHTPIDSHSEAFGQVYIEAMQSHVPIVCTKSGIANEILVSEKNALICNYKSSESILINIKRILTENSLRESITQQAYKDVQLLTFRKKIESLINLYKDLN